MTSTFVVWVSDELKRRNLSHTRFAELSGLSRPTVSNVLRGAIPASSDFVLATARALQVEPVSLLRLAGMVDTVGTVEADDPLAGLIAAIRELTPGQVDEVRRFVAFVATKKE